MLIFSFAKLLLLLRSLRLHCPTARQAAPLLRVVHAVYSFLPEEEGAELRKRAASLTISSSQPVRHQFPCIYFVKH